MKPIGYFIQPNGRLEVKIAFYDQRNNTELAYMTMKPLGFQVKVDFFGSMVWINIDREWIVK